MDLQAILYGLANRTTTLTLADKVAAAKAKYTSPEIAAWLTGGARQPRRRAPSAPCLLTFLTLLLVNLAFLAMVLWFPTAQMEDVRVALGDPPAELSDAQPRSPPPAAEA